MAHKKSRGRKPRQNRFERYKMEGRYAKNKKAKLEAHLKLNPEDVTAQKALKSISTYKRAKPESSVWDSLSKWFAQVAAKIKRSERAFGFDQKVHTKEDITLGFVTKSRSKGAVALA